MSAPLKRTNLRVRKFPLAEQPRDDLSSTTTAAERLEMVALLSAEAWELSRGTAPEIRRSALPIVRLPLSAHSR